MKNELILTLLLVLIPTLCFAGAIQEKHRAVIAKKNVGESPPAGAEITDSFGADTSANYTAITGAITMSGGFAVPNNAWGNSIAWHETAISSVDHYVQAECQQIASSQMSAVIARSNGTAYYAAVLNGGYIKLYLTAISGAGELASYNGSYATDGTYYTVKMAVSGSGATVNIKVYIDGTERINYNDEAAGRLTAGSYCGLAFRQDSGGTPKADDFECDAL